MSYIGPPPGMSPQISTPTNHKSMSNSTGATPQNTPVNPSFLESFDSTSSKSLSEQLNQISVAVPQHLLSAQPIGETPQNTPVAPSALTSSVKSKNGLLSSLSANLQQLSTKSVPHVEIAGQPLTQPPPVSSAKNMSGVSPSAIVDSLALSKQLENLLVGASSGLVESFPESVQNRIRALDIVQDEYFSIQDQMNHEIEQLKIKYNNILATAYQKRRDIISGATEPPYIPSAGEPGPDASSSGPQNATKNSSSNDTEEDSTVGIPSFWSIVFHTAPLLSDMITEKDDLVLKFLIDIRSETLETEVGSSAFTLHFDFSPNPYFTNPTLSKTYFLSRDANSMISVQKAESSSIIWKPGQNILIESYSVDDEEDEEDDDEEEAVTDGIADDNDDLDGEEDEPVHDKAFEAQDSFFKFFRSFTLSELANVSTEDRYAIQSDIEVGLVLYEDIIPNALLIFRGSYTSNGNSFNPFSKDAVESYFLKINEGYESDEDPDWVPPEDSSPHEGKEGEADANCNTA